MANHSVTLELPEELVTLLGSPDEAAATAKEALVVLLHRDARISQGKAARLLGITRADILDLMVKHEIPAGPATPEELEQELDTIRRIVADRQRRAGRQ